MKVGDKIPNITFHTRVDGDWKDVTTREIFAGKRVVIFSLPGAFTPTCSTKQLPGYEDNYEEILNREIDEVYCISVNDSFVMNAWAEKMNICNVKVIPDGSGNMTRFLGMLIGKNHLGFGNRSWRFMAVINDGVIERWWQEPGINNDGDDDDPYIESTPEKMMEYLESKNG